MHLPKPSEGGDFTPTPEGTHPATCYRFIDLGTQAGEYMGAPKIARKVMLSWEITDPELRMDDGKPFTISSRYTWSMHEKATLRKTLESWRGKKFEDGDFGPGGFDTKKLLGAGCYLSVIQTKKDDKTYSNISSIMKLPKGVAVTPAESPLVYFSLDADEFDREVFNTFSENLQNIIKASPEYQALGKPHAADDYVPPHFEAGDPGFHPDADIPF
jgi:hypothetical protein